MECTIKGVQPRPKILVREAGCLVLGGGAGQAGAMGLRLGSERELFPLDTGGF